MAGTSVCLTRLTVSEVARVRSSKVSEFESTHTQSFMVKNPLLKCPLFSFYPSNSESL